jgi:integrase
MTMALTATEIKALKPKEKDYKKFDGNGLFLLVTKKGSKLWRLKYRFNDKDKIIAIGAYPTISLADARIAALKLRQKISNGIDPSSERKAKREALKVKEITDANTFEKISTEFLSKKNELNASYKKKLDRAFERDVNPFIGKIPIVEVTPKDIIDVVKRIEERGAVETAHRIFTQISRVFKYAVSNQIADRNPCNDMDKNMVLKKHIKGNYPTITDEKKIGELLNLIDEYKGEYITRMALKFLPYVFVRPYNLRYAEWNEIDFKDRLWRIPAEKMKTKQEHLIPLTESTISILEDIHRLTGDGTYIFHGLRGKSSVMSDATLGNALRRMGYSKEEIVPHGFRAMFSTVAHEKSGFAHEVIEKQLAHSVGNQVSQAYNRSHLLQERKELMQWWSDYLNKLKASVDS